MSKNSYRVEFAFNVRGPWRVATAQSVNWTAARAAVSELLTHIPGCMCRIIPEAPDA